MLYLLDIARTGLAAVFLYPLRSLVSFLAVVTVLLPYLTGLAISQGVQAEAEASARFGADLYVSGSQFGRPAPIPLSAVDKIHRLDGVTEVVPRIVGEIVLGREHVHAVLVGVPPQHAAAWADCINGELPRTRSLNELVVGTALARQLELKIGSMLWPFYLNDRKGAHNSKVVGIFKADAPLWQAKLIFTTFDTAAAIFDQQYTATDLLVWCRPDALSDVRRILSRESFEPSPKGDVVRPSVTGRDDLLALLPRGLLHREGVFNLHFLLAFTIGILVLLVTSGIGLGERRREIGILKATGWQTDEILLRGLIESLSLSVAGACVALLLAWVWLRLLNGYGVAALFLDGASLQADFPVPFRLRPVPFVLAFVLSLAIVLTGTLYSSWRAAVTPPREAMR
jgi:ABC-type lipoprotein release transport system permease subunit